MFILFLTKLNINVAMFLSTGRTRLSKFNCSKWKYTERNWCLTAALRPSIHPVLHNFLSSLIYLTPHAPQVWLLAPLLNIYTTDNETVWDGATASARTWLETLVGTTNSTFADCPPHPMYFSWSSSPLKWVQLMNQIRYPLKIIGSRLPGSFI